MGYSAAAAAAAAVVGAYEGHKQRKAAEEQASIERERLAAIQAQKRSPIPDEDFIAAQRRRSIAGLAQRSGRQSTVLTGDASTSDPLGNSPS